MKRLTGVILAVSVLAVLAAGFFLISDTVFDFGFGIIRDTTVTTSVATLTQVRNVLSLNTVEVVRKIVFPYDFVPSEMNWDLFLKQAGTRQLSPVEEKYLETYKICEEIGINLRSKRREFVVITAIIRAGFDLSNPVFSSPEQAGEKLAEQYVRTDGAGGITIALPAVKITDLIIEDADTGTYRYPDIQIGPEKWKILTSFVKERIAGEGLSGEVLQVAAANGKQFLKRMFLDLGYSSVIFSQ